MVIKDFREIKELTQTKTWKLLAMLSTLKSYEDKNMNGALMQTIVPAVEKAQSQTGCITENAIKNNAQNMVEVLKNVKFENEVDVVSAIYSLETGIIDFEV